MAGFARGLVRYRREDRPVARMAGVILDGSRSEVRIIPRRGAVRIRQLEQFPCEISRAGQSDVQQRRTYELEIGPRDFIKLQLGRTGETPTIDCHHTAGRKLPAAWHN